METTTTPRSEERVRLVKSSTETADGKAGNMADRVRSLSLTKGNFQAQSKPQRRWGRWILLLAALGGVAAYAKSKLGTQPMRDLFQGAEVLQTVAVHTEATDSIVLTAAGSVIPRSPVTIMAQIPGRIVELPIHEGKRLEKGDLIARLDDSQYRIDLENAKGWIDW
jgi:multidrug efflux pump subunit AcrA (membrane-fusion protein)